MTASALLPLLVLASSFLAGLVIFFLAEERQRLRSVFNLSAALIKLGLIGLMLWGVYLGHDYEVRMPMLPGIDLVLRADALALLFMTLSALLWLFTTLYAIGYLEGSPHRSRFFGFFSLCVTASMGVALSGNLFTFFLFYEILTLSTYPLIVHRGNHKAMRAGNVYLYYLLGGGAVLLIGVIWLHGLVGDVEFTPGGFLADLPVEGHDELVIIFILLIAGIGVKAALVPLHGWLPVAMVAPAPVSALLHAVAVVKAGAFGIVRVIYDVYGIEFSADLGLLLPVAVIASITIVYGSIRALAQQDIKRRLAFSTVSQVSYIVLGTSILGPLATAGGLVHLVHQGLMKITMFFCAGNLAETLGVQRVNELHGVGRRMPWTMAAFTIAALGMIGVPPLAGFITKWYLSLGAHEADMDWVLLVLVGSSLLNAAYFLPMVYAAWFRGTTRQWRARHGRLECDWRLLIPTVACAALVIAAGVLAGTAFSPLDWARLITEREYLR